MSDRVPLARQVAWRALRWSPPRTSRGPGLLRQYAMRAGTFTVRDEPVEPWDHLPDGVLRSAPLDRAFYLADVDEVDEEGNASLTLWESPSGRALYGSLPPLEAHERLGPEPAPGDRLWIWTWRELPGGGASVTRRFVKVERRELTEEEKREMLERAARLEALSREDGES